jgi:protein-S-isoprenylcysteine O-methyltransferase Ste14
MKNSKRLALIYVVVQAIILLLLVFVDFSFALSLRRFTIIGTSFEWLGGLGVLLSAYSIRTSLTALPLPKEKGQLATGGLYKYVRHPMYTSVLLLSFGIALLSGQGLKYLLVLALCLLFYYKTKYEEKYLSLKYPSYKDYAKHTPRLIPFTK